MILIIKNEKKPHRSNAIIVTNDTHMLLDNATIIGKQLNKNEIKLIVKCTFYTIELIKFLIINNIEFELADDSSRDIILLINAKNVIEME